MTDTSSRPFELPRPGSAGDILLERVVEHIMNDGDPRDSLRSMAEAIGTSHRMLQYHFATKERLLGCVLLKIQARIPAVAREDIPTTRAEYVRFSWQLYRRPENFIMLELLLMITNPAAGALTDQTLMKKISGPWRESLIAMGQNEGLTPERATAEARLVVDAWRGFHQDLYGTLDAPAVDAAVEVLIEWLTPRG